MQLKKSLLSLALAGVVAVASTALVGCVSNTTSNSSTTNRSQLMLTPAAQINAQADQAYSQVIKQAKAKKLFWRSPHCQGANFQS